MQKDYQYIVDKAQILTLYLVVVSLPWPIRIGAWALALFVLVSVLNYKQLIQYKSSHLYFLIPCILYFLFHLFYFFSDRGIPNAWFEVEKKAAFLLLPLLLLNTRFIIDAQRSLNVMNYYVLSVVTASIVCFTYASIQYFTNSQSDIFYYHSLTQSIGHHAVYFSAQVIIAIAFSYYLITQNKNVRINSMIIFFLIITVLFLSSKIMIACLCLLLLIVFLKNLMAFRTTKTILISLLAAGMIIIGISISNKHISERFTDLSFNRIELVNQEKYSPSMYFDGLVLRLIQLKFAAQILNENHSWITGVGPARSQELLNDKYRNADMYTGDDHKGGYLGYNFHNQYAETLVRLGITGLVLLFIMIIYIFIYSIATRNFLLFVSTLLFSIFSFSESVFETQRGTVTFLFLTCILLKANYLKTLTVD
jgi:O-antigen ligase